MPTDHRNQLARIRRLDQLIAYLRDEMGWPIKTEDFEELTFDYTPEELGIDAKNAAKIQEIRRLRPLTARQPWGIFFVKFEPKKLPVVALRRILSQVALKKRASANSAERSAWAADDLLFVSNYGEGEERQISFAHFSKAADGHDLPTLKVLGWDNRDTALHLDAVARGLTEHLAWPEDESDAEAWREQWRAAFTLRHREAIKTSRQLSIRLAELARAIRDRAKTALAIETKHGQLTRLMMAFQEALVRDLDVDGFADMYAQTIAYGLLSARIAVPHEKPADNFAAQMRTNPFLRELMEAFLRVGGRRGKAGGSAVDFDELGVCEVIELLNDANLEAVVRDFGDRNPLEDPVIHFYELFLKEYDAKKRMQRGVFYTPRPVVSYIVRSVDELLRTEFGLEDGLADTSTWSDVVARSEGLRVPEGISHEQAFVQILDPACGTGTFLVETIDVIRATMATKWRAQGHSDERVQQLWNDYVPRHLLPRLHGYELLMAPYAIAHLKVGLKLYETGYHFGSEERARVYLTNALAPASDKRQVTLADIMPAIAHEVQAVNEIKGSQRFTVVIGNPPYANFGQLNRLPFILGLLDDYKQGLDEKKVNLDDDFIKFIRMAHHLLAQSATGIVAMITNNTFLDGSTRRIMRQRLCDTFDLIREIDLHGNSIEREVCPDGSPDANVFDIQQGVAISILSRSPSSRGTEADRADPTRSIHLHDVFGTREAKYEWLAANSVHSTPFIPVPVVGPFFRFQQRDEAQSREYERYFPISEMFVVRGSGIKTDRDELCFDFRKDRLKQRMARAFEGNLSAEFIEEFRIVDSSSYDLTRRLAALSFNPTFLRPCLYRLFDRRWLYYHPGFTSRPAWDVMKHMLNGNLALVAKRQARDGEYDWFFVTNNLMVDGLFSIDNKGREQLFPLFLCGSDSSHETELLPKRMLNLSAKFLDELEERIGAPVGDSQDTRDAIPPETVFHYAYAVFHSPGYRCRYADVLRVDFPRLPLSRDPDLFNALSRLGGDLVALHLLESPKLDRALSTYIGPENPEVGRAVWLDGTVWLNASGARKERVSATGGGFSGVPEKVWNFHIGGYQVCEKWLKDRKDRTLSKDEIVHYKKILVALDETISLMDRIDKAIEEHGGWPGAFSSA